MPALVTGAAGSIASEVCRALVAQGRDVVALDQAETPLFNLGRELPTLRTVLCDVADYAAVERVVEKVRPHLMVHGAAYKHVAMCEVNVREAVKNNVFATLNAVKAAARWSVPTFVLVSTDKAVNPTSVMGCTKRVAELVVHSHAKNRPWTKAKVVRFGNVRASAGSVVPIFEEQIAAGGPVTVTHRDVTRWMMSIPDAARLIIEASELDASLFVLDMGEPVSILAMAKEMIAGRDVRIEFTGLKPGEKMHEELVLGDERLERVRDGIMSARVRTVANMELALRRMRGCDEATLLRLLKQLVPEARLCAA